MDRQKLTELLQGTQIPDTNKIKEITAELQNNYYSKPECLLALIEIASTHPEASLRQQAAVQAARLASKHWKAIANSEKDAVRKHLMETAIKESIQKVRHSLSRLVASIAGLDLEAKQWPELLPNLVTMITSDSVTQREVSSYLIFNLLEEDPVFFMDHLKDLFRLFKVSIKDPQSRDVRINTMMAASCVLDIIEVDQDESSVHEIQELIPSMIEVLKDSIVNNDDERTKQAFEVIQSLLFYDSAFVNKYLRDLIQFMLDLGTNSEADEDVRIMALTFLNQAVKYRRLKIQGMRDMGAQLTVKAMHVVAEIGDDEDDDDITPGRTALGLIDQMAADLPPKQVLVPLLDQFPKFASSANPAERKAGILALGTCVEGAPDFVASQLKMILPIEMQLLNDQDVGVRSAALVGLTRLADDMAEELAPYHQDLMSAILKNLEFAVTNKEIPTPDTAAKKNVAIIRIVCAALDSMVDGIEQDDMVKYAPDLISKIGPLLATPDYRVKAASAGALGAIAQSIGTNFQPYFHETITALAPYIGIKDSEEDMDLRSSVCDAMGRIASAVGAEAFAPYLNDLMLASEEGLHLGSSRLKETSFILWSVLSKVYEGQFVKYLDGVFRGLFDTLEMEEEEVTIAMSDDNATGAEETIVAQGRKIKVKAVSEDDDAMTDEEELENFGAVSPEALEKEIAIEVLGDVITHACDATQISTYLEKSVEMVAPLVEHPYEGIRKAAIGCLWRCYARVWQILEETTGQKWDSVPPLEANEALVKLGEIVTQGTASVWEEEMDRNVVAEINRNIAAVLKTCGPAILKQGDFFDVILRVVQSIVVRSHPSQQDFGELEEDTTNGAEGSSEYDWVTIDTALDILIGLAVVLKADGKKVWELFEKPILKFAVSQESGERSVAVGVIAEMTAHIGSAITPYTEKILKNILKRLTDEDLETKSNAAYAVGQLIFHSTASNLYLPHYSPILQKLESMLQVTESRIRDNAAGCLCRMIMAHPDHVPLAEVLPALVGLLPLQQDFEENSPVYKCIYMLYEQGNQDIQNLTANLIPVFEKVLSPPPEQLTDDTRQTVCNLVVELYKAQPDLFRSSPSVLKLANVV